MKKLILIAVVALFTVGLVSCVDDKAENQVYEQSSDKDEEPDGKDE